MLWMWIRSDPHHFAGYTDWDRIQGLRVQIRPIRLGINSKRMLKVDKLYFFKEKFNMLSKILENYGIFDTDEKDKTL